MNLTPDQIIGAIRLYALPEIEAFLPPLVQLLPLEHLLMLAEAVAREIEAKTEKSAMQAGEQAVDDAVKAAQEADAKLEPTGGLT